mmetsp:Transcript_14541/g.28127  ORF Transcript_14541/g.28127 Transcript_14541/m.28127 type:complete len:1088 (-) Transcript_14541:1876-5139(-)
MSSRMQSKDSGNVSVTSPTKTRQQKDGGAKETEERHQVRSNTPTALRRKHPTVDEDDGNEELDDSFPTGSNEDMLHAKFTIHNQQLFDGQALSSNEHGASASSSEPKTNTTNDHKEQNEDEEEEAYTDDDEAEVEPLLKYQRVRGTLSTILEEVGLRITALALHTDIIVIGTSIGTIFELRHDGMLIRKTRHHRDRVTCIALDASGEAFASSSVDGRVVVGPTSKSNDDSNKVGFDTHNFRHPILAVALDPLFSKNRDRIFVCGGTAGRLILKRKGWFSSVENELHRGEGQISTIQWRTRLIAWSNEAGVKIYDHGHEKRIAYIERPAGSMSSNNSRCHMVWENDSVLLIAWADSVKIVRVYERSKEELLLDPNKLPRFAELISLYEFANTETICGISPFGPDQLALLTYLDNSHPTTQDTHDHDSNDGSEAEEEIECPELRVIARADGEPVSMEALPIRGYERNSMLDYALVSAHELVKSSANIPVLFIMSPFDVVSARPRTLEDHIAYNLQTGRYAVALGLAENALAKRQVLRNYTLRGLQDKLLNSLLMEEEFDQAASLCPRILGQDVDRWLQWASKFESLQHLRALAGYLPVRQPQLPAIVYESVIDELLRVRDDTALLRIIRQWESLLSNHARALFRDDYDEITNHETNQISERSEKNRSVPLFDIRKVIERIHTVIDNEFGRVPAPLRESLAELYVINGQYTKALEEYLKASASDSIKNTERSEIIFSLIEQHGLASAVANRVADLVSLNEKRALALFIELVTSELGADEAGASLAADLMSSIVDQLQAISETALLSFLHDLSRRRREEYNQERMSRFQNLQIRLYAQHRPVDLLEFLETANHYSLQEALEVCENRSGGPLYRAMVFILGRTGGYENVQRALAIIIENLRDIKYAIQFVEAEGGAGLWSDLVRRCVKDPALVGPLLESAGAHDVDLVQIFREMPPDLVVPGLSRKLPKLFEDIRLQQRIRHTCNDILRQDAVELFRALHRRRKKAVQVCGGTRCEICKLRLSSQIANNPGVTSQMPRVVIFGSGQAYHYSCLDVASQARLSSGQHATASIKSRHIQTFAASFGIEDSDQGI